MINFKDTCGKYESTEIPVLIQHVETSRMRIAKKLQMMTVEKKLSQHQLHVHTSQNQATSSEYTKKEVFFHLPEIEYKLPYRPLVPHELSSKTSAGPIIIDMTTIRRTGINI